MEGARLIQMCYSDHNSEETVLLSEWQAYIGPMKWARFSFVSWWDMKDFDLNRLVHIVGTFDLAKRVASIGPDIHRMLTENLHLTTDMARDLGFVSTLQQSRRIAQKHFEGKPYQKIDVDDLRRDLDNLVSRCRDEMAGRLAFVVDPGMEYFYTHNQFTDEVVQQFEDAKFDMEESGKCFALGRYAGCVFHLMRVLAHGIKRLGSHYSVPIAGRPEDRVLKFLKDRIEKSEIAEREALKNLIYKLELALDVVRHPLSHSDEGVNTELYLRIDKKFTQEETMNIMQNVRSAMDTITKFVS